MQDGKPKQTIIVHTSSGSYMAVKAMERELTRDEKIEVAKFWREHPDLLDIEVATHFEGKWGMPVTRTCVTSIAIADQLGHL